MKLSAFIILSLFFFCSCNFSIKRNKKEYKQYDLICDIFKNPYYIIMGFTIFENYDSLAYTKIIRDTRYSDTIPAVIQRKIPIDKKTKQIIVEVFQKQLEINDFYFDGKKNHGYVVLFQAHTDTSSFLPNRSIKSEYSNIDKNSDISVEYEELIKLLKSKFGEFEDWPD